MRWPFPDSPDPDDLRIVSSYFDRTPVRGDRRRRRRTVYVEHHRTVGDWVRAVVGAGCVLEDLVEPEWTPGRTQNWGQWSPERGALVPGTLILVCRPDPTPVAPPPESVLPDQRGRPALRVDGYLVRVG